MIPPAAETPAGAQSAPSAGDRLRAHWRAEAERWAEVSAHSPVGESGRLGAALGVSRRAVRYLLRWYINPIVEQQNHFNAALLSLEALDRAREQELLRELAELQARVGDLERQLAAASVQVTEPAAD
jgi:hypothetical protein